MRGYHHVYYCTKKNYFQCIKCFSSLHVIFLTRNNELFITLLAPHDYFKKGLYVVSPKFCFFIRMNFGTIVLLFIIINDYICHKQKIFFCLSFLNKYEFLKVF